MHINRTNPDYSRLMALRAQQSTEQAKDSSADLKPSTEKYIVNNDYSEFYGGVGKESGVANLNYDNLNKLANAGIDLSSLDEWFGQGNDAGNMPGLNSQIIDGTTGKPVKASGGIATDINDVLAGQKESSAAAISGQSGSIDLDTVAANSGIITSEAEEIDDSNVAGTIDLNNIQGEENKPLFIKIRETLDKVVEEEGGDINSGSMSENDKDELALKIGGRFESLMEGSEHSLKGFSGDEKKIVKGVIAALKKEGLTGQEINKESGVINKESETVTASTFPINTESEAISLDNEDNGVAADVEASSVSGAVDIEDETIPGAWDESNIARTTNEYKNPYDEIYMEGKYNNKV